MIHKRICLHTLILCLFCVNTFAQLREIVKNLEKVNEQLYASNTEVSNKQYADFLEALRDAHDTQTLAISQIDSTQWRTKESYNEPYVSYYHQHKAYENYPVVNISYNAALAYCNWLTKQYEQSSHKKYKKVIFRLPSEKEWEIAAQAGNNQAVYPWKENTFVNSKGQILANFKRGNGDTTGVAAFLNDNADVTAPVKSYWPNAFGLYNMAGNVAEMTASNNIVKGGSWKNTAENLIITNAQKYDGSPKANIGFRCFMQILEE